MILSDTEVKTRRCQSSSVRTHSFTILLDVLRKTPKTQVSTVGNMRRFERVTDYRVFIYPTDAQLDCCKC